MKIGDLVYHEDVNDSGIVVYIGTYTMPATLMVRMNDGKTIITYEEDLRLVSEVKQ
jgi:hypothetical protein